MELLVIDASVRDGRGRVVLSDQNRDPTTARLITLEFPLRAEPEGSFAEREARIVEDAEAVLHDAREALRLR